MSVLPGWLIRSESGGRFDARNSVRGAGGHIGHFGRAQFGIARLEDAKRAGVIPPGMTPEQFMADEGAQDAAERWHQADIMSFIAENGLDRFVGQEINGVPITPDGLLAVAHLGGKGGLKRFLETGGAYNPADANGTTLLKYLGGGIGGASVVGGTPSNGLTPPAPENALAGPATPAEAAKRMGLRSNALDVRDFMQPMNPLAAQPISAPRFLRG